MFKTLFSVFISLLITCSALAKTADTAVMFFRFADSGIKPVRTLDSADYYMLILPPNQDDPRYNIQEFYKDNKIKFLGKADPSTNCMKTGIVLLDGDCISYFHSGAKSADTHYTKGYKEGFEKLYYPNGAIHGVMKHVLGATARQDETFYWTCYDVDGSEICTDGKGKWKNYDEDLKIVELQGDIIKGRQDGEWNGMIVKPDTIKYKYLYRRGERLSATGFDKNGKSYAFNLDQTNATYKGGYLTFVEVLHERVKFPRDANGLKMNGDTVHVSFVIEKDGSITHPDVVGDVDPQLKESVITALAKCSGWTPMKLFGVPFRTQMIFPLKEVTKHFDKFTLKETSYEQHILKDGQ